jgi:hypothetical protein
MKLYTTYSCATNLRNNYSVVEGEDHGDCRAKIHEVTGGKFAFAYTEEEFEGQIERYGLTEVPLQPQTILPEPEW